jgi:16S rRNA (adenine1518-N6/adenine1519-N6)-dimethyltransferase
VNKFIQKYFQIKIALVKPKKHLGQHFLKDKNIALRIVEALTLHRAYQHVLEIGPGTGVLSDTLLLQQAYDTTLVDIDTESINYLRQKYPEHCASIIEGDFLGMDLRALFSEPFAVIGNFPYNISSQIFFRILQYRQDIPEVVCMLQKEVAERIASPPGSKVYGILSVLLQAYYDIEYLFTVLPGVFNPPPKVNSAVIRLKRNEVITLSCNESLFVRVVKQGFNNRRKTLRNALKPLQLGESLLSDVLLDKRAEQLSVQDFIGLTQKIENSWSN